MKMKKLDKIKNEISKIEGALLGLSSLFQQGSVELDFTSNQIFGIGELIEILQERLKHSLKKLEKIIDGGESN